MNRRGFLSAALAPLAAPAQTRPPNVVVILADDMGYGDARCYNPDSKVPTPEIDRLAAQGMRFTDAHSPSAVCTPTRYGLLTGRYCWRTSLTEGVLWGYSPSLIEPGRITLASLLKSRGYATGGVGKWHLGLGNTPKTDYGKPLRPGPPDFGFDYYFGIPASLDMDPYLYFENDRVVEKPTGFLKASKKGEGGFWREGAAAPGFRHADVLPKLTDKAVEFVRRQSQAKPFFLYFPLTAPHTPWVPTAGYRGRSGAGDYGDFVAQVDESVGRLLREVDERNTLVIFTSDNGAHWLPEEIAGFRHRANGPLRGMKADIWEGGHRIPFLAKWPGRIHPGTTSDQIVCLTDILGTVAEISAAPLPDDAGEDSFSLMPAFQNREMKRAAVVHHSVTGMFAIRQGTWKLILGRGSAGFSIPRTYKPKAGEPLGELYDMRGDPGEQNNLYLQRPSVVRELTALLARYRREGRSRSSSAVNR
jgi:arylsulfatase A-like enzyme